MLNADDNEYASRLIDVIPKKTKLHMQHSFSSNYQKKNLHVQHAFCLSLVAVLHDYNAVLYG